MDSVKKQLRFFKVLVAVLLMVVITQFTFWVASVSNSSSSRFDVLPKMKPMQHSKVIAPAVSGAIDFLFELTSNK